MYLYITVLLVHRQQTLYFNNGKYIDRFSVTCYTIVENSNCWAMGNVYQFFGSTFVIFLIVSRFSIFVFWWLVFVINVFSSWQLTRLDLTGTFFELENSEPLMFRLYFCCAGNHRRSVWGKHC